MKLDLKSDLYRRLPSVDELARAEETSPLIKREGEVAVLNAARTVLARLRSEISAGIIDESGIDIALTSLTLALEIELQQLTKFSLRSVINATGVILHTNLGRAPLSASALEHIRNTAGGYSNLEFDIESGSRGKRDVHVDRLFRKLFDAHVGKATPGLPGEQRSPDVSTIVVNNNAAAVLLALNTLAESSEVIVSRGELVEIGGSFRIPDIMAKSGAILREIGTTNRTNLSDYESAINEKTKLLLRVHRSNFEISGFTERPSLDELVALARLRNLPLMEDLGSGALFDMSAAGIKNEPTVFDSLHAGVDVVAYSGDKLLGGPQAGILSGSPELISKMRANSLFRALRVDKLTFAALEATLLAYVKRDYDAIPALRMMRLAKEEIKMRADRLVFQIRSSRIAAEIIDGESIIGGGAAPSAILPTSLLALTCSGFDADELAERLRSGNPAIISRVQESRVLLDLRTVLPEQDASIAQELAKFG
jgi:L-seryl-tRNA(Ser) seleniumtransferase